MNESIIYQTPDNKTQVEVKIEDETVWLTLQQMTQLFNQIKQNISLHINNCFKENFSCQGTLDNCFEWEKVPKL